MTHRTMLQLLDISKKHALVAGATTVADANVTAAHVKRRDVVFIDPPYSGVHYSRFYHVLETINRGSCGAVSGAGRYPPANERPQSKYSIQTQSRAAVADLLRQIASKKAVGVITFPNKKCSNGISSYFLRKVAHECFPTVESQIVRGRFSTLGGDGAHREARQFCDELILILRP